MRKPILAIDGPAGAGKSTIARLVARRLGLTYIDTGAMYRAVALAAARRGVDVDDPEGLSRLAGALSFRFVETADGARLLVDGEDVSEAIRQPEISQLASRVSAVSGVRAALVRAQRALGEAGGVVMEGRDITTVVFPNADVKVYLDATAQERARRRHGDLVQAGHAAELESVRREIEERDRRDSSRADSPMRQAPEAFYVLTDGLTVDEVIEHVTSLVEERTGP